MTTHDEDVRCVRESMQFFDDYHGQWIDRLDGPPAFDRILARLEAAEKRATDKCGIHESCAGCHHENTDGEDERTCIQKLHDDFHAAEKRAQVAEAQIDSLFSPIGGEL